MNWHCGTRCIGLLKAKLTVFSLIHSIWLLLLTCLVWQKHAWWWNLPWTPWHCFLVTASIANLKITRGQEYWEVDFDEQGWKVGVLYPTLGQWSWFFCFSFSPLVDSYTWLNLMDCEWPPMPSMAVHCPTPPWSWGTWISWLHHFNFLTYHLINGATTKQTFGVQNMVTIAIKSISDTLLSSFALYSQICKYYHVFLYTNL